MFLFFPFWVDGQRSMAAHLPHPVVIQVMMSAGLRGGRQRV